MYDNLNMLQLVKLAQQNDCDAKEKLIKDNSPLIKSVIRRFKNKGIEYEDLFQLGSLGFLKAINNFDESFNVKFSTYAVPMIAGEVKRFLRDNGIIKVSRSIKTLNIMINRYVEQYINEFGKAPHIDTIATHFETTAQEIVFAMESNRHPLSLYSAVGEDEGNKQQLLIDKVPNYTMEKDMDVFLIYKEIKKLSPRDRKIIILRYFRDKTQKEIAEELGVSQVQVSRLENKILSEIKNKVLDN